MLKFNVFALKLIIVLILSFPIASNGKEDGKDCSYHYFKNHKVSTSQCYEGNRFGKAIAYDRLGKVIYEKELRKIAGHSSVQFTYYADGAVKEAEWHSAPDAGIQWYSSKTSFAADGTITGYTENNYDDYQHIRVQVPLEKPVVEPKKEVVPCAEIYTSEFWFINKTKKVVIIHADRIAGQEEFHTVAVKPGDTVKGGSMIQAQYFDNPDKYYIFSANYNERSRKLLKVRRVGELQAARTNKRFFFTVE